MVTALECFLLFFTDTIIGDIARHTNSFAWGHVAQTSCTTHTNPDGSWNDTNIEEIKRLIALLIYFGLVKVGGQCSNYWSTKTLYNGLWARGIMSRKRYKAPMAFLHVVDPDEEVPRDKLRCMENIQGKGAKVRVVTTDRHASIKSCKHQVRNESTPT